VFSPFVVISFGAPPVITTLYTVFEICLLCSGIDKTIFLNPLILNKVQISTNYQKIIFKFFFLQLFLHGAGTVILTVREITLIKNVLKHIILESNQECVIGLLIQTFSFDHCNTNYLKNLTSIGVNFCWCQNIFIG